MRFFAELFEDVGIDRQVLLRVLHRSGERDAVPHRAAGEPKPLAHQLGKGHRPQSSAPVEHRPEVVDVAFDGRLVPEGDSVCVALPLREHANHARGQTIGAEDEVSDLQVADGSRPFWRLHGSVDR